MTRQSSKHGRASGENSGVDSNEATPGRPTQSGSRQQTHPNQSAQSGSPEADRDLTRQSGSTPVPAKPPGSK